MGSRRVNAKLCKGSDGDGGKYPIQTATSCYRIHLSNKLSQTRSPRRLTPFLGILGYYAAATIEFQQLKVGVDF